MSYKSRAFAAVGAAVVVDAVVAVAVAVDATETNNDDDDTMGRRVTDAPSTAIDALPTAAAADGNGGHRCGRHLFDELYWHSSTFLNASRNTLLKMV